MPYTEHANLMKLYVLIWWSYT